MQWNKYFDVSDCGSLKTKLRYGIAFVIAISVILLITHMNYNNPVMMTLGYLALFAGMGYVAYMTFYSSCDFKEN